MADINQSFIRAFAKKDAASNAAAATTTPSAKRSTRRPSAAASKLAAAPKPAAPQIQEQDVPTMSGSPIDLLLSAESVIIGPTYYEERPEASPALASPWNTELAEAAKSAAAATPRDIGKRSKIPAPPAPPQPHFETSRVAPRVDPAHHGAPALPKIEAAWEVDQLNWPRTCEQLLQEEKAYFVEAAERLKEAASQGLRTLAVCGSRRGEGSSTIVLCIARAAAVAGLKVGVLDADAQGNGLSEMLGLEVECDWTRAAASPDAIHDNALLALEPSLVLFLRAAGGKPVKEGVSPEALALIPQIAEQFDLLIIDFGAFADGAMPQAIKNGATLDAALVVRDLRHTSSRVVQATVSKLREAGLEAVGIAENFGAR